MIKTITTLLFIPLFIACSANKKMNIANETNVKFDMPACLQSLIKKMTAEPNGSPQSVTRYTYKDQTVYYLVSPCCDKYNVVYDSSCNILGYPDGGFTGSGDGKMTNFADDATNKKIVWITE